MRVELTEYLTHDTGGLLGLSRVAESQSVHAEKHAALDRLQSIADVGKGTGDDYGHRIVDVRRTHLVVYLYGFYEAVDGLLDFFFLIYSVIHKSLLDLHIFINAQIY